MRKIFILLAIFLPKLIYAQTIVPAVIDSDLWIKQNSPYVIESDVLVQGDLVIEPGVVVQIGDANIDSFKIVGTIHIKGTKDEPVVFESYGEENKNWSLVIDSSSTSLVDRAIFRNSLNGLIVRQGEAVFRDSTFSNLSFCLTVDHAQVVVEDSVFTGCDSGAAYVEQGHLKIVNSDMIGTGEAQGILLQNYSTLDFSSSTLQNFSNAILSDDSTIRVTHADFIANGVALSSKFSDVLIEESTFQKNDIAISLFKSGPIFSGGIGNAMAPADMITVRNSEFLDSKTYDVSNLSDITVDAVQNWWGNNDGPKKNIGKVSVDPWIKRSVDCCSSVLFIPGFQASRLSVPGNQLWEPNRNADVEKLFLNEKGLSSTTVSATEIIDKGIGYKIYDTLIKTLDSGGISWRAYPYDWRRNQLDIAKEIVPTLISLASSSPTGKVHILSHSNGGLVAKALVKNIVEIGKENLIDSLIFIAVPHLGTPKAIASLLYGYDQEIAKGIILNKKIARQFGYNTPAAYTLLPTTYAMPSGGVASSSKELDKPMALNKVLFNQAKNIHKTIDSISFPKIFSLTGWNVQTPNSLNTATMMGDGTVVASSSALKEGYFFNIGKYNIEKKQNINHANITESAAVIDFIKNIITAATGTDPYISKKVPVIDPKYTQLVIKMFSPVEIHAYDSEGRHTGPALDQEEREREMDMEPGFVTFIDEEIPNSSYTEIDDVKTISIPNEGSYTIQGIGTDVGTFTLQTSIENAKGEEKILARYTDLPVLKDSKIEIKIQPQKPSQNLKIDIEGDGTFENSVKPNRARKMDIKRFLDFCKRVLPYIKKHEYKKYIHEFIKD